MFAGFPTDDSTLIAISNWTRSLRSGIDIGSLTNIHSVECIDGKGTIPHISVLTDWSGDTNYTEYKFYYDGRITAESRQGNTGEYFPIENLTFTIYGVYSKLVPQRAL